MHYIIDILVSCFVILLYTCAASVRGHGGRGWAAAREQSVLLFGLKNVK